MPKEKETAYAADTFFGNNFQLEAYNPDVLITRKGKHIYNKMLKDAQVRSAFDLILDVITSRKWRFEVTEDTPEQQKIKEFFHYNIEQEFSGEWTQALRTILMAKAYGYSISEKIWSAGEHKGKPRWFIKAIKSKDPFSFIMFQDRYGNITRLEQDVIGRRIKLDKNKFIIYVNNPERNPLFGESDLQAVYRPYWEKDNILKLWNIYLERLAGGFILATPNERAGVLSGAEKAEFEKILRNISQITALRAPQGYDVDLIQGVDTDAFENAIRHRDSQIARALLVPNLLGFSEQGVAGSFSQSKTHLELFMQIITRQTMMLADTLHEQLFSELSYVNFGTRFCPKIVFETTTEEMKMRLVESWRAAVESGIVRNTFDDEIRTRKLLGYDLRDEDAELNISPEQPKAEGEEEPEEKKDEEKKEEPEEKEKEKEKVSVNSLDHLYNDGIKNLNCLFSDALSGLSEDFTKDFEVDKVIKSAINQETRRIMKSAYNEGRNDAKKYLLDMSSNLDKKIQNKIIASISLSERNTVKIVRGKEEEYKWSFNNFLNESNLEPVEKYCQSKGFWITGLFTNSVNDLLSESEDYDSFKESMDARLDAGITESIVKGIYSAYTQGQFSVYGCKDLSDFISGFYCTREEGYVYSEEFLSYYGKQFKKDDPIFTSENNFFSTVQNRIIPITEIKG